MRFLLTCLAAVLVLGAASFAASVSAAAATTPGDVVNSKCPVSDMPIKEGVVVKTPKGDIGVCCNKCKAKVEGWDDAKKAKFVANALKDDKKVAQKQKTDDKPAKWGEPYLLDVCAASGRPLDVKGTPTTKIIDGRELKFCCGGCADVVAKDPAKWVAKVDEKIKARQVAIYPTKECVVSGEPLFEGKKDAAVSVVVNNRLFRTCCKMCAKKVTKEPAKYAAKLDELAMEAQAKHYPLENCVVNEKGALGEKAQKVMIGGRLVQTCCGGCAKKVKKDPAKYVAKVDAAWKAAHADKAKDAKPAGKGGDPR